ncbi:Flp pilus assembly protein CpaB [Oceanobacillus salinisoli]|uniref:Flp pilus assembly protein CpaB n=1 Tax=Oceanobacillus salinisoli TaxID=2678611 RepID=UPI0012E0D96E|nr:SAF domain-containing protein [Oceanobacillus salinisoli]
MIESKKRAGIFFILAFILALIAGYLVYGKVKELNAELGGMTEVYVANGDIPSRVVLQEDQLAKMEIPNKFVTDSHITDFSEVQNRVSVVPLSEGDIITNNMIKPVSNLNNEDHRLVSIHRKENVQFDQVIEALDRVDIIVSSDEETETFLTDVPVVYAQGTNDNFSGIAVELSTKDAERLIHQQNYADYIRILKANVGKGDTMITGEEESAEEGASNEETEQVPEEEVTNEESEQEPEEQDAE